jgi:CHAT domain-containing protein
MSLNYHQLKAPEKYLRLSNEALIIARRIRHFREEARCLNNIGIFYYEKNIYARALIYYRQALSVLGEKSENDSDLSAVLNNMGAIYRELGAYEKAIGYISRALAIDTRLEDYEGMTVELGNLAATYRRKGIYFADSNDIYLSLKLNLESLEAANKTSAREARIAAMNNVGLAYAANKSYVQAINYFRLAIRTSQSTESSSEACNVFSNMGFVFIEKEDYSKAEECFRRGLEIVLEAGRNDVLWEIYFGLGLCLKEQGRYEDAIICYEKAISTINYMRNHLSLDDYKVGFIRDKMKAYDALLDLLFDLREKEKTTKYDAEIFEVVEKAKARVFLEEMERSDRPSLHASDQKYKGEEASLSKKISLTISELVSRDLGESQRHKLLTRLGQEEEDYASLLNKKNTEAAEKFGIASPQVISIDTLVRQHLNGKSAILEYYLGEKRSFGILIAKDRMAMKALPPRAEIEDSLRGYLKMLSSPPKGTFQGGLAAQRIYRQLVNPFQEVLPKERGHLIFVPDGILHYLPFETLMCDDLQSGKPRFLIELFEISYAPSATSFAYLMEKEKGIQFRKSLLAVGAPVYLFAKPRSFVGGGDHEDVLREIYLSDGFELTELPHSKQEVERVARCFRSGEVEVLSESRAKEEEIKSRSLGDYRFIHFACHGFLDEQIPARSALVLTLDEDPNEDGFLQAREIASLELNADLVVLSACQTGKGRIENGEGVLGLPRSFFYAGARSTISSLWKIDDKSTSEIMPEFYRRLADGHNKAQSLRLAKLDMLYSRFAHPFYWGAFILNGNYLVAGR